jgi:tape measure domain-containing protein
MLGSDAAELRALVTADITDYMRKMQKVDSTGAAVARRQTSALGTLGRSLETGLKVGLLALGAGMAALGGIVAKTGIQFEMTKTRALVAFGTMMHSTQKATVFVKQLQVFAAKTPFSFQGLIPVAQRMMAMGFAAKQVIPMLTAVGDAEAALGGGEEGVNQVTSALGVMLAKGKVTGEEMRRLTEAGIPGWQMLAKSMGKTVPEVMKLSEQGLLPAAKAIDIIQKGMERTFGGNMQKLSKTFEGQWSNLKDNFEQISGSIMAVFMPSLTKAAQRLNDFFGTAKGQELQANLANLATSFLHLGETAVGALGSIVNAAGALNSAGALGPLLTGGVAFYGTIKALTTISGLMTKIGAAGGIAAALGSGGPILAIATAVGLAAAGIYYLSTQESDLERKTRGASQAMADQVSAIQNLKAARATAAGSKDAIDEARLGLRQSRLGVAGAKTAYQQALASGDKAAIAQAKLALDQANFQHHQAVVTLGKAKEVYDAAVKAARDAAKKVDVAQTARAAMTAAASNAGYDAVMKDLPWMMTSGANGPEAQAAARAAAKASSIAAVADAYRNYGAMVEGATADEKQLGVSISDIIMKMQQVPENQDINIAFQMLADGKPITDIVAFIQSEINREHPPQLPIVIDPRFDLPGGVSQSAFAVALAGLMPKRAAGTRTSGAEVAIIGEKGTEYVVPVTGANRDRGRALWRMAGVDLGMLAGGGVRGRPSGTAQSSMPISRFDKLDPDTMRNYIDDYSQQTGRWRRYFERDGTVTKRENDALVWRMQRLKRLEEHFRRRLLEKKLNDEARGVRNSILDLSQDIADQQTSGVTAASVDPRIQANAEKQAYSQGLGRMLAAVFAQSGDLVLNVKTMAVAPTQQNQSASSQLANAGNDTARRRQITGPRTRVAFG